MRKDSKKGITTSIILTTIILLAQIQNTRCYTEVTLDEDRNQNIRLTLKKRKTIKITLSDSALSDLSSNEQFFFYTSKSKGYSQVTLSSKRDPKMDEQVSHLVGYNVEETGIFSKNGHKKIWEEVASTKVLYLTVTNEDSRENENTVEINIRIAESYVINDLKEFKMERQRVFDTRISKEIPVKIHFTPKSKSSFLKLVTSINNNDEQTEFKTFNLDIFGKIEKDFKSEMPTKSTSHFTMLQYNDNLFAHVVDSHNAENCYTGGCYVNLVFSADEKLEFLGFSASSIDDIEDITDYVQIVI